MTLDADVHRLGRSRGAAATRPRRSRASRAVLRRFVAALPGLLLVALIFVGIRAGIFTAVESAAIAVVYALLVTALLYRQPDAGATSSRPACGAARTTGLILFVIARGRVVRLAARLPAGARRGGRGPDGGGRPTRHVLLLLMILVLLVLGTFMDLAPLIIICTPIFLPVAKAFGVDPVHFGVILILNGGIGLITPPVGLGAVRRHRDRQDQRRRRRCARSGRSGSRRSSCC